MSGPASAAPLLPGHPPVAGPAFGRSARCMASLLVVAVAVSAWRAADAPVLAQAGAGVQALLAGTLAMMLWLWSWILRSRTQVVDGRIEQTWLWDKRVEIDAIITAKFIYLPCLAWLVSPRLVVRTSAGIVTQFHAIDPEVLRAFAALSLALRERQAGRR